VEPLPRRKSVAGNIERIRSKKTGFMTVKEKWAKCVFEKRPCACPGYAIGCPEL